MTSLVRERVRVCTALLCDEFVNYFNLNKVQPLEGGLSERQGERQGLGDVVFMKVREISVWKVIDHQGIR